MDLGNSKHNLVSDTVLLVHVLSEAPQITDEPRRIDVAS